MNQCKPVFVAVAALSLLVVACKINKDSNCLNPKAACYNKDTEQPSVIATMPVSAPLGQTTASNNSLTEVVITFSEPMKNADKKANYPNPTNTGAANLSIVSVDKIDERNYRINLTGPVSGGQIDFDLRALVDLSNNALTNPQFTITGSSVNLQHEYVSTGGYTSTLITWSNSTNAIVSYQVKIGNGTCASGTVNASGPNVSPASGAGIPISDHTVATEQTFTILEAAIVSNPTFFHICLTGPGVDTDLPFSVGRDDTPPTIDTITGGVFARPYVITLTCNDALMDKIAYTTDGTTDPNFTVAGAVNGSSTQYVPATGLSIPLGQIQLRFRCIDKGGNKVNVSALYDFKSAMVWDTSVWFNGAPNDYWK